MSVGVILLVVALVLFLLACVNWPPVVALVLFLLACVNWPQVPVGLGRLGLFFLTLYFLVGRA